MSIHLNLINVLFNNLIHIVPFFSKYFIFLYHRILLQIIHDYSLLIIMYLRIIGIGINYSEH